MQVADSGENSIVVLAGATAHVGPDAVALAQETISRAPIVVVQGEIPAAAVTAAILAAEGRVIVNLAPVIALDHPALLRASPLVVNEHEALLVLQQFTDASTHQDTDDHASVLENLLRCGFSSVVLTLGSAGALVSQDNKGLHVLGRVSQWDEGCVGMIGG